MHGCILWDKKVFVGTGVAMGLGASTLRRGIVLIGLTNMKNVYGGFGSVSNLAPLAAGHLWVQLLLAGENLDGYRSPCVGVRISDLQQLRK